MAGRSDPTKPSSGSEEKTRLGSQLTERTETEGRVLFLWKCTGDSFCQKVPILKNSIFRRNRLAEKPKLHPVALTVRHTEPRAANGSAVAHVALSTQSVRPDGRCLVEGGCRRGRTDTRVREKSSPGSPRRTRAQQPWGLPSPPARCAARGLPRTKGERRASALHAHALKLKTSGLFPGGLSSRGIARGMKCVSLCQCVRQQIAPAGGGRHHQQPPASCVLPGLRPPSWKEAV